MSARRRFAPALKAGALAMAAGRCAPLAAGEPALSHPADICVERGVDAELGGHAVDLILEAAELAEPPGDILPGLVAIFTDCVKQHGEPTSDGALVGGLVISRAMRNEAARRLEARGMDIAWLGQAVDTAKVQAAGDLTRTSEAVYDLMRRDPPAGPAIDVEDGTEASRLTGVLVHAYVSGALQAEKWGRLMGS